MRLEALHIQIGDQINDTNGSGDKGDVIKFRTGPLNDFE